MQGYVDSRLRGPADQSAMKPTAGIEVEMQEEPTVLRALVGWLAIAHNHLPDDPGRLFSDLD
jgi:hypothetical protein